MLTSYEIFKKLPGTWIFERTLNNLLQPQSSGVVNGHAKFIPVHGTQNLIHYLETGIFETKGGAKYPITKEYFFAFNEQTHNIEKYFAEHGAKSGLFYVLGQDLSGEHLCVKDNYKARYNYLDDDFQEFSINYEVTGPQKNYSSETRYKNKHDL